MMDLKNVVTVLGCQWGDEGKGKLIDIISKNFDIIVRAAGGANAGHTIYLKDPSTPDKPKKFVFHLVPSGMFNENCVCVIGNGVVLSLQTLSEEVDLLKQSGIKTENRILISDRAHLLFEYHKIIDGMQEDGRGTKKVGTTKRGIGPCYTDKIKRSGIRVHELRNFEKFTEKYLQNVETVKRQFGIKDYDTESELNVLKNLTEKFMPSIIEGSHYLNKSILVGKKILIEGANGAMLDIDHGTYPFVTSSNSTIGGIVTGTGIGATKIDQVIGIMKAYTTRVGEGPFPTELKNELGNKIRETGGEYGATTGRPRRCGWFDAVIGKYAVEINGLSEINITKLDVLSGLKTLKIATSYKLNGKILESFPAETESLNDIEVEYEEMPGWSENISKIRKFEDLPKTAQEYIKRIETILDCKISSIGVGVTAEDMMFR